VTTGRGDDDAKARRASPRARAVSSGSCLQHPQGIATDGERVWVADTCNHRIKVLDPVKRTVKTLAGTGKPGLADGRLDRAQCDEPGGLSLAGRTLYVTDANNHAVRAIDLDRGVVSTLRLG